MKYIQLIALSVLLLNCKNKETKLPNASGIIDASLETSGSGVIDTSTIAFDFRDIHYRAERRGGQFRLERIFKDSISDIRDELRNSGFKRYRNDSLVQLPDSMVTIYSASVNSVHYFSVLPYGLDGKAVNKTYLEEVTIKDKTYHKIKVTFSEEGGGEDFEDVFVYWIDKETSKIDYLAYSYKEEDGLGLRFREAYNERYIKGVRFVDYNNYKPKDTTVDLTELDRLFVENELELLSKIELKNLTIN